MAGPTSPPQAELDAKFQEIIVAETPWIEEKFTAIHGLLVALSSETFQMLMEQPIPRVKLRGIGDTEFTDWRVALTYTTEENLLKFYKDQNLSTDAGTPVYRPGLMTTGLVQRELDGYKIWENGDLLWTRKNDGFAVDDVGRTLTDGTGTLTLGLSQRMAYNLS